MKLLYLSCHSILEYDEVKLLTELGHDVFSPHGAYENPQNPSDPKRPAIPEATFHQQLADVSRQSERDVLHPELIEWCDAIIVMHKPEWIPQNVGRGKPVIWRTIGQSIEGVEKFLEVSRYKGLKVIRMSPRERNIPGFIGEDALIRFYKDPEEFKDWQGHRAVVVNYTQSMPQRADHCHFQSFKDVASGGDFPLPVFLYGPGNEDSGFSGGLTSYDQMKEIMRTCRCYFYTGTEPASYTLSFIEPMMTGMPVVALGPKLGSTIYPYNLYEVPDIIENGVSGFYSDDIEELKSQINTVLTDIELAHRMTAKGRERAIELFGKEKIKEDWRKFLETV